MENNPSKEMMVFHQICEINDLDPQQIIQEAKDRCPEKLQQGKDAEAYIWTAYEHRVHDVLKDVEPGLTSEQNAAATTKAYRIDPDPAAPAFVVNEDYIRSKYSEEKSLNIINALEHIRLPVTG